MTPFVLNPERCNDCNHDGTDHRTGRCLGRTAYAECRCEEFVPSGRFQCQGLIRGDYRIVSSPRLPHPIDAILATRQRAKELEAEQLRWLRWADENLNSTLTRKMIKEPHCCPNRQRRAYGGCLCGCEVGCRLHD